MESKKKTVEEKVAEKQMDNLLKFIIAKTFSRHAKMTEEEFLKSIGFAGSGKTETEAICIGAFNVLCESTKTLLEIIDTMKRTTEVMKVCIPPEKEKELKDGK